MLIFQVKIIPLDPKAKAEERKRAIRELSALDVGALICGQIYENTINGFENRLLVVTRKFDDKLQVIGLAGIPEVFAARENYPKMLRLVERAVNLEEIARFSEVKNGEMVRISTKNGEQAVGKFSRANVETGYPGVSKLEVVIVGGSKKSPVEEIVEISDITSVEYLGRKPARKEEFAPYEFH